jgi:indolepyruvate ferredoxin oxidoreductase alpha subunit
MLCQGCPHTDLYQTLTEALANQANNKVFSDIGCYTLGALKPLEAVHSCVCMGASIGMALGAAGAGVHPVCAVIGDSTFGHAGMPALLAAAKANVRMTVVVVDNDYVAMTGGQESACSGEALDKIILGLGVHPDHLRVITPLKKNAAENLRVLREEIDYDGLSVVVSRRVCIQKKPTTT